MEQEKRRSDMVKFIEKALDKFLPSANDADVCFEMVALDSHGERIPNANRTLYRGKFEEKLVEAFEELVRRGTLVDLSTLRLREIFTDANVNYDPLGFSAMFFAERSLQGCVVKALELLIKREGMDVGNFVIRHKKWDGRDDHGGKMCVQLEKWGRQIGDDVEYMPISKIASSLLYASVALIDKAV